MSTGAGAVGGPPAANLDQCKNGSTGTEACIGSNWVNGNLGASNSKYFEGDSIPYRIGLTNLDAGTHTVTIQWDTTKSGKHAIDYLTTWDRTANAGSNACDGYTCGAGTTTLAIPADPNVTGGGVTPIAGNFTLFGGTLSSVGGYTLSAPYTGDSSTSITISFSVPGNADAVLAWGGHIATRSDWGTTSSAVDIPGSPYHSRLLDLDGSGGNQDRSLSAEAVIFPASITLIKDAIPNGATSFSFTDTGGLTPTSFSLVDDGTSANTQAFTNIQTFTTYTFTEGAATGWTLSFGNPVCTVTSADGGTQSADTGTRTLTITLAEGEDVTCTFTNTQSQKASPTISTTPSAGGVIGTVLNDTATLSGGSSPTGSVTFKLFPPSDATCAGTAAYTFTDATAPYATTPGFTSDAAGTWHWTADYAGDANNNPASSGCAAEPVVITKISSSTATTIHDANHGTVTSVPAGTTVHDSATVSGSGPTPTGTVDFTWFTNGTCTGSGTASGTGIALVAGVADPSTSQTPATAGSYAFQATYSGDSVYDGSTGPCEPLTVTKISSSTATTIHDTDHNPVTSVAVGTTVHDSATVSGAGPTPTGTVSFTWFNEGRCDSEGTSAGSITLVGGVAHPSTSQTPSTPGMYSFQATYSGDNVYDGSTGDCEPLTVTEASSSTATTIHDANHNAVTSVLAGTTVHDSASVSATAGGTPTGTVTFQWFTNGSCTGTAAATSSAFTLVSGTVDGTTFTQTPNSAGSYSFQAVYSGDTNHTGSTGPCEPLTVTQLPPPPPPPPPPAGAVTVIKHVVNSNGGTKTAADFNIHVKSSNGSDVANSPQAGSETGTAYVLLAGTYTVSEDAVPEGYVQTSITCDGVATATITVASAGDTHTCTITNSDLPASLTVIKHVVNASGNAVASDFTMTVTGGSPSPASFPGSETGTLVTLSAGTYSVSETTRIGYTATFSADCSGTIAIGQSKTCTITNTQSAPPAGTLTVIKHVITTTGATKTAADFTVHVKLNGTDVTGSPQAGSETGTAYTLNPGTYTVSEDTPPAGYVQVSITCDGAASATVTIASAGDTHTCTITNQAVPAPQPPNTGNSGHIATTLSIWWVLLAVLGSLALTGSGTAVLVRRARRA